ncbi:hypothetical protein Hanom_Chr05g00413941 [Helianthus anomalus]
MMLSHFLTGTCSTMCENITVAPLLDCPTPLIRSSKPSVWSWSPIIRSVVAPNLHRA